MNLLLETIDAWDLGEVDNATQFFSALHHILMPSDVLSVGSYDWCPQVRSWFQSHALPSLVRCPFTHCFDLNRDQYPEGEAISIRADRSHLEEISGLLAERAWRSPELMFIDHVVAFREGVPMVPLLNYRYAFRGGRLLLSGLYHECEVKVFAEAVSRTFSCIQNPVLAP